MLFHEPLYVTFQIIKITNKQQVKRISPLTFLLHLSDLLFLFLFLFVCLSCLRRSYNLFRFMVFSQK